MEVDPYCCETLRASTSRKGNATRVIEADIRGLEPVSLINELDLRAGELDLLCGGPPCQSFSQIGKQGALKDERGLLLFQMVRFAEVFKPKAIFIEQVTGLLSAKDKQGQRGEVLQMLLSDLDKLGYVPKWKVMSSADYGVPQMRKRVFIVATEKPNGFEFPEPTHGLPKSTAPCSRSNPTPPREKS